MNVFKVFSFLLILSGGLHETQSAAQDPLDGLKIFVSYTGKTLAATNEQEDVNDFPLSKEDNKEINKVFESLKSVNPESIIDIYIKLSSWTALLAYYNNFDEKSEIPYYKDFCNAIKKNVEGPRINASQSTHIMDYPSEICARLILDNFFDIKGKSFDNNRSLFMWQQIDKWIDSYEGRLSKDSLLLANKMLFDKIFRHPDSILAKLTWVATRFVSIDRNALQGFLDKLHDNYLTGGGCYPGYRNRLVEYIFEQYNSNNNLVVVRKAIQQPVPDTPYNPELLKNFYDLREPISKVEDNVAFNAYLLPVLHEAYYCNITDCILFKECTSIGELCKKLSDCGNQKEVCLQEPKSIQQIIKHNLNPKSSNLPGGKSQIGGDHELAQKMQEEQERMRKDRELALRLAREEGYSYDLSSPLFNASDNEPQDNNYFSLPATSFNASYNKFQDNNYFSLSSPSFNASYNKPQDNNYFSLPATLFNASYNKPQDIEDDGELSDSEVNYDSYYENYMRVIKESKSEYEKLKKISSNSYKPEYKKPSYNDKYNYNYNDLSVDPYSSNIVNELPVDPYSSNIINKLPDLKEELNKLKNTEDVDLLTSLILICQKENQLKVEKSENRPGCIDLAAKVLESCESLKKRRDNLKAQDIHVILKFLTNNQLYDRSIADDIFIKLYNKNNLHLSVYNGEDLKNYLNDLKDNNREIESLRKWINQPLKTNGDMLEYNKSKTAYMKKIVDILNNFPKGITLDFTWQDICDILKFLTGGEVKDIIAQDAYFANKNYKSYRAAMLYNQSKKYKDSKGHDLMPQLLKDNKSVEVFTKNINKWRYAMRNHDLDTFINQMQAICNNNFTSFDMFEILTQIRGGMPWDARTAVDIWLYVKQYCL